MFFHLRVLQMHCLWVHRNIPCMQMYTSLLLRPHHTWRNTLTRPYPAPVILHNISRSNNSCPGQLKPPILFPFEHNKTRKISLWDDMNALKTIPNHAKPTQPQNEKRDKKQTRRTGLLNPLLIIISRQLIQKPLKTAYRPKRPAV